MKLFPLIGISLSMLSLSGGRASAQAVTEYGSMASKSAGVAKRADGITSEIGGIWKSLDKTIKGSQEHTASSPARSGSTAQHTRLRTQKPARTVPAVHEEPSGIQPGIGYDELIRRFGPAAFEVTTGPRTRSLAYPDKRGDITVELFDEKVVRVVPPAPQQVITLASQ